MKLRNLFISVITILVNGMLYVQGHWPSGPHNQQYDMRRNMFHQNNPDLVPQNYHFQQMNGNQLVNYQSACNCIKLKFCSPVMEMARKMYNGFIADYINSQLNVIACNNIDNEMAVCCPDRDPLDSREKRGQAKHGHEHGHDKKWVWDTDEITSSEEVHFSKHPAPPKYPMNRYVTYPIQGFYPFSKLNLKNAIRSPFLASHEDPASMKNCPPPFSSEFNLPGNHSFFKEPEDVTTPVPRIEIVTEPESESFPVTPEMKSKMSLINDESCGRSVVPRIIGGEDTGIGRFKWMARLAYKNKTSGRVSYRCAGSLFSDRYVLTAGHCVSNLVDTLELTLVRLGEYDSDREKECSNVGSCSNEEDFEIEKIVVHPSYNHPRYANDIALIRLKQSTVTSNAIGPICLPIGKYREDSSTITEGSNGIIAGWGARRRTSEAQSKILQWIRLPFVEISQCASFYANYTSSFRSQIMISNSQLCVQGRENGDACAGDSGGPLMNEAELGNDKFILLGLVSFGPRQCGLSNFPGVYTRISTYMEWILKNIET